MDGDKRCLCAYCEEAEAEGYVQAYDSWVCQECYDDNHSRY